MQQMRAPASTARPRLLSLNYRQQDTLSGVLLILPAIMVLTGLVVWPFVNAISISMTDKAVGSPGTFVGLSNFAYLLGWPRFLTAVSNSFLFSVTAISLKLIIGMALALALNERLPLRGLWRTVVLIPWIMPAFVVYLTWRWIFDPVSGLINYVLSDLGLITYPIDWLGNRTSAQLAVVIAYVWRGVPFYTISFLAALQNIPQELYEAASTDGANVWQRFRHITLPGLRHIILVVIMLSTMWTFNAFEPIYILTGGGPSDATLVYTMFSFRIAIQNMQLGQGSAVSVLLLPFLVTYILFITQVMREKE